MMVKPSLFSLSMALLPIALFAAPPRQPGEATPRGVAFITRYKKATDSAAKPSQAQLNLQQRMREQRNPQPAQTPRVFPSTLPPTNLSEDRHAHLQFLRQQHLELEKEANTITFSGNTHSSNCPDYSFFEPDTPIPPGHSCIRRRLSENEYQQSRLLGIRTPTTTISKRAFEKILEGNSALRAQGIHQELPWQGTHLVIE